MSNSMPRFHGFKMQAGHGGLGVPISNRSRSQVLASGMEPALQMSTNSGHGMDPDEIYSFNEHRCPPSPIAVSTPSRMPRERHGVIGNVGSSSPEFFGSARSNQGPRSIPSAVITPLIPAMRVTTERRVSARRSNHGLEPRIGGGRTLCFSDTEELMLEEQQRQPKLPSKTRKAISQRSSSNVSIESEPVDIPCSNEPERDTTLEEEGWSSLWDNYTRVFPGTHGGCSPPRPECRRPPESPLYFTPKNHSNTAALMVTPPSSRPYHSSSFKRRDVDSATSDQKTGGGRGRLSQMSFEDREGSKLGRAARSIAFAGTVTPATVDAGGDWNDANSEEEACVGPTEDSDCTAGLIFDMEL